MVKSAAIIAAVLGLSACSIIPLPGRKHDPAPAIDTDGRWRGARREQPTPGSEPPDPPLSRKVASAKEAPASLLAGDGTRCLVNAKKFRKTRVGDHVWCVWTQ